MGPTEQQVRDDKAAQLAQDLVKFGVERAREMGVGKVDILIACECALAAYMSEVIDAQYEKVAVDTFAKHLLARMQQMRIMERPAAGSA